ncbi:hypothetical protein BASA81_004845 [Batrachochytrium salamandrivorans]|nr:hypothetical protein BASA81_004845 [Batrachochytrium salamandrivorans]
MLYWVLSLGLVLGLGFAWWYALTFQIKRHSFAGKRCVVVGAGSGIGKQVAILLAEQAGELILIDKCDLTELRSELEPRVDRLVTIQCDVSMLSEVEEKISFDRPIDLLVLCAGVLSGKGVNAMTSQDFDRVLHTNVSSQFYLIKLAMANRQSLSVVSVSSLMGFIGGSKLVDYCASKFALMGMFEALKLEHYYDKSVRFSVVCPWVVSTGMFNGIFARMWWVTLCFPFLAADRVAREIVHCAETGRAVSIIPFWFTPLAYGVRVLPEFLYFPVLIALGGRSGMETFQGKRKNLA